MFHTQRKQEQAFSNLTIFDVNTQEEQSVQIQQVFSQMKKKEDFLSLLNYVKPIIYGEKAIPFTLKQLNYHTNPKLNSKRYIQFTVTKKSGADRIINAPNKGLKTIQKCINLIFQTIYQDINSACTGFVPGKSIVDNATVHTGKLYVYNIDLKDFFPSIDQARIWGRLQFPPFNLNKENGKLEIANMIASLCCQEMEVERLNSREEWEKIKKSVLPQGAPTSPFLTNIICQKLDYYMQAVAKRFGLTYSRYADDITFSSMHNVYQIDSEFIKEINKIVSQQGFNINPKKTRLQKEGYRKEVTGLVVNNKPNVQQRYIKQLRMWLYYWETYGYEIASGYFIRQYKLDKGNVKKGEPSMANVIGGKLDYMKMVKGQENEMYIKLKTRYNLLIGNNNVIDNVLNIWESEGIENAMKQYNHKTIE